MSENVLQIQRQTGFSPTTKRKEMDFYITPKEATKALLEKEIFEGDGWEPACGNGAISKFFPKIYSSDIRTDETIYGEKGIDFLKANKKKDFIITNPPFSLALEFAEHSLFCANKVALFVRLQFLEGKKRGIFFERFPPKRVYIFSNRLNCDAEQKGGSGMMCFAWIIWEKNFSGLPTIEWLNTSKIRDNSTRESEKE